jgi:hypothetical protein
MSTCANAPEGSRGVAVVSRGSRPRDITTAARPSASDRLTRTASALATIAQQLDDYAEAATIAVRDFRAEVEELSAALAEMGREARP